MEIQNTSLNIVFIRLNYFKESYIFIKIYLYIYKNLLLYYHYLLMPQKNPFMKCNGTLRCLEKKLIIEGKSQSESEMIQILFQLSLMILFICTDLIIHF